MEANEEVDDQPPLAANDGDEGYDSAVNVGEMFKNTTSLLCKGLASIPETVWNAMVSLTQVMWGAICTLLLCQPCRRPGEGGGDGKLRAIWNMCRRKSRAIMNVVLMDEDLMDNRVPIFYTGLPRRRKTVAGWVGVAVGTVFGALQFTAFAFAFPQHNWKPWITLSFHHKRASFGYPTLSFRGCGDQCPKVWNWLLIGIAVLTCLAYAGARLAVLILAFKSLWSFPPEVYETFHWADFLTHI